MQRLQEYCLESLRPVGLEGRSQGLVATSRNWNDMNQQIYLICIAIALYHRLESVAHGMPN